MAYLDDGYTLDILNGLSVQKPCDIDWSVTLCDHTLDANSVACVGWLLAEGEGMDLGYNCHRKLLLNLCYI